MKTALITGATSDIGIEIIKELIKNEFAILALGRSSKKLAELVRISENIKTKEIDLSKTELVEVVSEEIKREYQ